MVVCYFVLKRFEPCFVSFTYFVIVFGIQSYAQVEYIDYFPKFRTENQKVFIPKIRYFGDTIIMDVVIIGRGGYQKLVFSPSVDTSAWFLTNTIIPKYQHVAKRYPLEICDLSVDHVIKKNGLKEVNRTS